MGLSKRAFRALLLGFLSVVVLPALPAAPQGEDPVQTPTQIPAPEEPPGQGSLAGPEPPTELSEPLAQPPAKPVSEMTPEELKVFRAWRRQRMLERGLVEDGEGSEKPQRDGVTFDLAFPQDQGGGTAAGVAGAISYEREDYVLLTGVVNLEYQGLELEADRIEVDLATKKVLAVGNVILDQGPQRLTGDSLDFSLEDKTGGLTNASAYVDPDMYFTGREIRKTGENTYLVVDGVFTSCDDPVPDWSFSMSRAEVTVDAYARVRNATMKVKKLPLLYLPYVLWPVKPDRTAGLLIPNVGYSNRRGGYLGLAYYQPIGRSYDTTFFLDLYSKEFYGVGNEFRYQPSENTAGVFEGYAIRDPDGNSGNGEWRWKVSYDHDTRDLPWGLRGVVSVREFSDFNFFRDFERSTDKNTLRTLESRGFLSGNWGPQSLNVLVKRRETFISDDRTVVLAQYPEVEYSLRPYQLGSTPLYLEVDSSASFIDLERSQTLNGSYARADLFPQLSLPLQVAPWLSVKVGAGGRFTYYGDSLDAGGDGFSGDTLTRTVSVADAEVVGPSFSRIFETPNGAFTKYKHVIEPRITYSFQDDFDDSGLVPLFDEVDGLRANNLATVSLSNRIKAKPRPKKGKDGEEGQEGSAREILLWEVARGFSLDDAQPLQRGTDPDSGMLETTTDGPITNLVRFNPTERTNLTARVTYNTLFSQVSDTSLSGTLGFGRNAADLSYRTRWDPATGNKLSDQAKIGAAFDLIPRRLRLQTDLVYDIEASLLQQHRYILNYESRCYSFRLEAREVDRGVSKDRDFRFSVSLKNVGTFLDLTN